VWTGTWALNAFGSLYQIFGQRLDATGAEIGTDAQLTAVTGDNADYADVAYDPVGKQYLVSFVASNDSAGSETFVQQVDAATGAQVGPDDYRLSHQGPDDDTSGGYANSWSDVACGPASGACLVVWHGSDDVGGLTLSEVEIFGQLYAVGTTIFVSGFEDGDLGDWLAWPPP
jgi:hypothetical protein